MNSKKRSPRRKGREIAFQILYGCTFSGNAPLEHASLSLDHFIAVGLFTEQRANEFARELSVAVLNSCPEVDRIIESYSKNWRLKRIARVELTILRLAVYEMLFQEDVPMKVAINEGIELSKTFGDPKSGHFVNGILDGIAREAFRPDSDQGNEQVTT
ncbi:MAG: transcription antitermination factor NusB [Desulfohalobiaceae bacterium]|nr:transcription antitermination factor NusB [Desulfohalobiaceae bacterium]